MLRLTNWPLSLQVILLFSDKKQKSVYEHIIHILIYVLMIFCMKLLHLKWKQGTIFIILHDGLYIYMYTFSIFQYTFIGRVWWGPVAYMYQVHAWDTTTSPSPPAPPPPPPRIRIELPGSCMRRVCMIRSYIAPWSYFIHIDGGYHDFTLDVGDNLFSNPKSIFSVFFLYGKTDLSSSEGHCHIPYCCFVKSDIIFGNVKLNSQSCIHLQAIG